MNIIFQSVSVFQTMFHTPVQKQYSHHSLFHDSCYSHHNICSSIFMLFMFKKININEAISMIQSFFQKRSELTIIRQFFILNRKSQEMVRCSHDQQFADVVSILTRRFWYEKCKICSISYHLLTNLTIEQKVKNLFRVITKYLENRLSRDYDFVGVFQVRS